MKKIINILLFLPLMISTISHADCFKEAAVTKWEVISYFQILAYSGEKNLAILNTSNGGLKSGQNIALRFFSPSICNGDNIMIDGNAYRVNSVELIRQK